MTGAEDLEPRERVPGQGEGDLPGDLSESAGRTEAAHGSAASTSGAGVAAGSSEREPRSDTGSAAGSGVAAAPGSKTASPAHGEGARSDDSQREPASVGGASDEGSAEAPEGAVAASAGDADTAGGGSERMPSSGADWDRGDGVVTPAPGMTATGGGTAIPGREHQALTGADSSDAASEGASAFAAASSTGGSGAPSYRGEQEPRQGEDADAWPATHSAQPTLGDDVPASAPPFRRLDDGPADPDTSVPPPLTDPPGVLTRAAVVALGTGVIAGIVWGYLAVAVDREVGAAAWVAGVSVGLATHFASRTAVTAWPRLLAVAGALVALLVGKYLEFALVVQNAINDEQGVQVRALSWDMLNAFRDHPGRVFAASDALWALLAIASAFIAAAPYRIPEEDGATGGEPGRRAVLERLTRGLPHGTRVAIDWTITIVGAVAIVLAVKSWVVNPYRIPSSSMESTLHCALPADGCEARYSDRVLANRFIYHFTDPSRGDIIVFDTPQIARVKCGAGGTFVKRIVGLPGETISVRLGNGTETVFINGKPLAESYLDPSRIGHSETMPPQKIPDDAYFVMGDNRTKSCDSRVWGTVPRHSVIGKVFATYWPPNRISIY